MWASEQIIELPVKCEGIWYRMSLPCVYSKNKKLYLCSKNVRFEARSKGSSHGYIVYSYIYRARVRELYYSPQ
jgi:hypothetical protein